MRLAPGRENNLKYIELARFAVTEHNSKTNGMLEFERLVKVRTQVVAGVLYYFTVEVKEGGTKKLYESTVWETNLKTLTSFRPIATETTAAALHKLTSLLHIFMLRSCSQEMNQSFRTVKLSPSSQCDFPSKLELVVAGG
ncbi:hypothetical protein PR202_gb01669 [Eleusine coracana subsp. coracana]|uniref:Cysteine proteinase inhibitor n=1 Tax=Eleusine coracana subsp. coracana TaxID=191504 RepID=A0AAV5DWH1_ELECO|nr:hypothetical protein PR202_gb01669 [Eleusine coracana subsp. coracana]